MFATTVGANGGRPWRRSLRSKPALTEFAAAFADAASIAGASWS